LYEANRGSGEAHTNKKRNEEEHNRKREIRGDTRENHHAASEDRRLPETARIFARGTWVPVFLAEHPNIAAERKRAKRVLGFTKAEGFALGVAHLNRSTPVLAHHARVGGAETEPNAAAVTRDARSHANRKSIGPNPRPLRGEKVPEFVDEDQEAEAKKNEEKA
jgi:formylmethanofuran dehydrogenase subunit E-like metal-binding protein